MFEPERKNKVERAERKIQTIKKMLRAIKIGSVYD